jgi:hypothetical protein
MLIAAHIRRSKYKMFMRGERQFALCKNQGDENWQIFAKSQELMKEDG